MKNAQSKIALSLYGGVAFIIGSSLLVGLIFSRQSNGAVTDQPPVDINPPPIFDVDFPSSEYVSEDGFAIDLVEGWSLQSYTPDRRVDRYRFERQGDAGTVFTVSIYGKDDPNLASLDDVVVRRYGASVLQENENVEVNGFTAKRVSADFDTGNALDLIVDFDDTSYISLYGLHAPQGEADILINQEIDYMQQSVRSSKSEI